MKHPAPRAWSAAITPPLAWALLQQGWGQLARQACGGSATGGLAAGFACIVALLLGGSLAWTVRRADGTARFVALIAIGETAIFGLAVVVQLIAGYLVPPCWR